MKTKLLKSLLTIACLLCSIGIQAHDFEVDGVYFNITNETEKTVEVTYKGSYYYEYFNEYTGSVIIPNSVTFNSVTYNVTEIANDAFYECSGLISITIPNSVTEIGNNAFCYSGLTSIIIPNSVTSIDYYAFRCCTGLTSITIENGNTVYDSRENCNAIIETATNTLIAGCKNTVIPNTIKTIGSNAFNECKTLTSISIPESVTEIGDYAFANCTGLTEVTIPNSVISIGKSAFSRCTGLTEVTVPKSVISIYDYAFYGCSKLTFVTIHNGITSLSNYIFKDCTSMTSITLPNSISSLGNSVFENCKSLRSITVPESVTEIGEACFYNSGLYEMVVKASTPPTLYSSNTFEGIYKSIPVYVPAGCEEAYRSADYWSEFTNIQEITIPDVIATSLTLDNEVLEMYPGDAVQLTATILPDNTTNKVVTWTSSDNEVATVDENGNVTAVSIGSATITATTTDGSNLTATCEVTVVQKMVKLTMQNSYYNNVIFFLLPGTEQKIQIVNIDPMFVLNTVMFNDENVTEQLVDGVYTTPALEEDAVINISYDIPTAEDTPMQNSRIKAYGYRGDVVVVGCERGESIAIYDVDGILLRTIFATSNTMRIAMPTDAVYVVKVADAAVKVAL